MKNFVFFLSASFYSFNTFSASDDHTQMHIPSLTNFLIILKQSLVTDLNFNIVDIFSSENILKKWLTYLKNFNESSEITFQYKDCQTAIDKMLVFFQETTNKEYAIDRGLGWLEIKHECLCLFSKQFSAFLKSREPDPKGQYLWLEEINLEKKSLAMYEKYLEKEDNEKTTK